MRQAFVVVGVVSFLFFSVFPADGQYLKEYDQPNPYLSTSSDEQADLVKKYYHRIFAGQKDAQLFRSGQVYPGDQYSLLESGRTGFGFEGPINPTEYIVGPLDVLTITVWGVVPFTHTGPVTPEGTLILPTIGEIPVAGESLAEVKVKIQQALRKKYEAGEITVTLWSVRALRVTVAGVVKKPGSYIVTPIDRVDRVVYLANLSFDSSGTSLKITSPEKASAVRPSDDEQATAISLRNIKLFRANGDTVEVDLMRYYAVGDIRYNPHVRDNDVIWVPAENLDGNSVSIYGGVRVPGWFEFHRGDSLLTLLQMAQGPTELADLEHVEIARFLPDGQQVQMFHVNLQAIRSGQAPDIALQRNDRVFIRENRQLRRERTVFVKGAVHSPGAYALPHENTSLSEIIERAGGFTAEASIAESKVIRRYENPDALLNKADYVRMMDLRLNDLSSENRDYFNFETVIRRGFVSVDFVKLFNHHEKTADVYLMDGDEIYVPSIRANVYVFGQVVNPGYVTYVEGTNYRYYLEKAGGLSKEADRDKIRIVKRGTKAWMEPNSVRVEPGDQIFVPRMVRHPFSYYFNFARDVLQVTTGLATIAILIIQVQK